MSESTELIYPYPAKVLRVDVQARMADLMTLAQGQKAFDPSIFDERKPFFWSAEISNSLVDSYFTRMMPSTLDNFTADAKAGVSFLNSHRHNELPFGRSLDAHQEDSGDKQRVIADFFTLPGLNLNGVTTDHFIDGVRSGIISDVSVGFSQGEMICGICGKDYRSMDCPHLPGMKYEEKTGSTIKSTLCTVSIENARLAEVSGVYDGATPDATILKAQRMAEAGTLPAKAAKALETRYRQKLFDTKRTFAGVSIPERKLKMELEQQMNQIREVLSLKEGDDVVTAVLTTSSRVAAFDAIEQEAITLRAKVTELSAQAADGATYRADLVSETLAEGVRALGDKFSKETYETLLRDAPLSSIKKIKENFTVVGNTRFPGGRASTDDNNLAPEKTTVKKQPAYVPAQAYKS